MEGQEPPPQRTCEHCGEEIPWARVQLRAPKRLLYVPTLCSCEGAQAAAEAAEGERRRQERQQMVAEMIQAAGLNAGKWARMTLETWDPARNPPHTQQALDAVRAYVADIERKDSNWLFLYGPYGVGKTHLALGALRRLAQERLLPPRVVVWPEHCTAVQSSWNDGPGPREGELWQRMRNARVLLVDDLDKRRPTPWAMGKLYEMVDFRYRREKPTLFTANHSLGDLVESWGEIDRGPKRTAEAAETRDAAAAVLSRIAGQLWGTIEIKGSDQRW